MKVYALNIDTQMAMLIVDVPKQQKVNISGEYILRIITHTYIATIDLLHLYIL